MAKATAVPECREVQSITVGWTNSLQFVKRDQELLASYFDSPTRIEVSSGKTLGTLAASSDKGVCWCVIDALSRWYAGGVFQTLVLWNSTTNSVEREFSSPSGIVSSVAVSPDGQSLVFGTWDKRLVAVDPVSGRELWQASLKTSFAGRVEITFDGRFCITGGNDKTLRLWKMSNGEFVRELGRHGGYVQGLAMLPDGRKVLSASRDKTLCLWDLQSATQLASLSGHKKEVRAVRVTSDGRRAVSAGGDGVRIWDLKQQTQIASFSGHGKSVSSLAITGDDRHVASGGEDGQIRIWELP